MEIDLGGLQGAEMMLAFYDRSGFFELLSSRGRIGLAFNYGFFKTPYGAIGVDLWGLKQAGRLVWTFEWMRSTQNLHLDEALLKLDRLSYLHYLLGDRHGIVVDVLECRNTINFASLARDHLDVLSAFPCTDHDAAVKHFHSQHPATELARMLLSEAVQPL